MGSFTPRPGDIYFCPPVSGRWILLEAKQGLSLAPRGQVPHVHVWQQRFGPGASLKLRGPLGKRQMYFDKPATASTAS